MIFSPSQIESVFGYWTPDRKLEVTDFKDTCERKWYFEKVLKLPKKEKKYTKFGNVFHEVCYRYLNTDDNGNDRLTQNPVNLFPNGWDSEVTREESILIKKYVDYCIDHGHLVRHPNRKCEAPLSDGLSHWSGFGSQIFKIAEDTYLTGSVDYFYDNVIVDFKALSNPSKYMNTDNPKSQKYLGYDIAMLIYGYWLHKCGTTKYSEYVFKHLYINKKSDPENLQVLETEITVSSEVVEKFGNWLLSFCAYLTEIKNNLEIKDIENLHKGETACKKYGGCDFIEICERRMSIENYTQIQNQNKGDSMNALERLRQARKEKEQKTTVKKVPEVSKEEVKKAPSKKTSEAPEKKGNDMIPEVVGTNKEVEETLSVASSFKLDTSIEKHDIKIFYGNVYVSDPTKKIKVQELVHMLHKNASGLKIWDRLELYKDNLPEILKELDGKVLYCHKDMGTEAANLIDLIIPFAEEV